jgi:hypothetical protein
VIATLPDERVFRFASNLQEPVCRGVFTGNEPSVAHRRKVITSVQKSPPVFVHHHIWYRQSRVSRLTDNAKHEGNSTLGLETGQA